MTWQHDVIEWEARDAFDIGKQKVAHPSEGLKIHSASPAGNSSSLKMASWPSQSPWVSKV